MSRCVNLLASHLVAVGSAVHIAVLLAQPVTVTPDLALPLATAIVSSLELVDVDGR